MLEFSGVPQTFMKDPFMVTLVVEKANVKGLGDAAGSDPKSKRTK